MFVWYLKCRLGPSHPVLELAQQPGILMQEGTAMQSTLRAI